MTRNSRTGTEMAARGLALAAWLWAGCDPDQNGGDASLPDAGACHGAHSDACATHDAGDKHDASDPHADAGAPEDAGSPDAAGPTLDGASCTSDAGDDDSLDPNTMAALSALSPLPAVPADTTNKYADSPAAAALGQAWFFDPAFSGALKQASDLGAVGDVGKVSCASCHGGSVLADVRSSPANVSLGTDFHTRNPPALVNASFYKWTNWGGRFSAPWELPPAVVENPITMNGNRLAVAHRIFDHYKAAYEAVFGAIPADLTDTARFPVAGKPKPVTTPPTDDGPWEKMTAEDRTLVNRILVNFGKALEAHNRLLVSREAPFDAFVAGDVTAISSAAKRGARLFVGKARCVSCHDGPHLSDGDFHNIGVPQTGPHVPASDDGRFKDVPPLLSSPINSASAFSDDVNTGRLAGLTNPMPESTRSAFRTPSLRGVAESAPYMHAGQLATLEDVIEFYDDGGGTPARGSKDPRIVPLGLSDDERADLLAFLKTLTGKPVPAELVRAP